jgi:hypothetical protein
MNRKSICGALSAILIDRGRRGRPRRGSAAHLLRGQKPKPGTSPAVSAKMRSDQGYRIAPFGPLLDEQQLRQGKSERKL